MNIARTLITAVFGALIAYEKWGIREQSRNANAAKRGNLSPFGYGNPVASLKMTFRKALETIHGASLWDEEIVHAL